jgi:hypothetical protein
MNILDVRHTLVVLDHCDEFQNDEEKTRAFHETVASFVTRLDSENLLCTDSLLHLN